jgi:hypothetical protein
MAPVSYVPTTTVDQMTDTPAFKILATQHNSLPPPALVQPVLLIHIKMHQTTPNVPKIPVPRERFFLSLALVFYAVTTPLSPQMDISAFNLTVSY